MKEITNNKIFPMIFDRHEQTASFLNTIKRLIVTFDERMERWTDHWVEEIDQSYSRDNQSQQES